jgi:hypothetical protein
MFENNKYMIFIPDNNFINGATWVKEPYIDVGRHGK